jgi:hypothetical protein
MGFAFGEPLDAAKLRVVAVDKDERPTRPFVDHIGHVARFRTGRRLVASRRLQFQPAERFDGLDPARAEAEPRPAAFDALPVEAPSRAAERLEKLEEKRPENAQSDDFERN